jgi:hypothetical protein
MKKEKKNLLAVMFEDDFDVIGLGGGGGSGGSGGSGGVSGVSECGSGRLNVDGTVTVVWA